MTDKSLPENHKVATIKMKLFRKAEFVLKGPLPSL